MLGPIAGLIGSIQANEVLKKVLNVGKNLDGSILIINLLNLDFRKAKIKKIKGCFCNK